MPKSNTQRKAEERERRTKEGLKRVELWLYPADRPAVQRLVGRLRQARQVRKMMRLTASTILLAVLTACGGGVAQRPPCGPLAFNRASL